MYARSLNHLLYPLPLHFTASFMPHTYITKNQPKVFTNNRNDFTVSNLFIKSPYSTACIALCELLANPITVIS